MNPDSVSTRRAEAEVARTQRLIRQLAIAVAALLVIMQMVATVYAMWSASTARRQTNILVECTTPSSKESKHECYDRGIASQGKAVGNINLTAIYVAECALEGTKPPLTPCVERKIKQGGSK